MIDRMYTILATFIGILCIYSALMTDNSYPIVYGITLLVLAGLINLTR